MDYCNVFALVGHNNIEPENKLKRIKKIIRHERAFEIGYHKYNIGSEEVSFKQVFFTCVF